MILQRLWVVYQQDIEYIIINNEINLILVLYLNF